MREKIEPNKSAAVSLKIQLTDEQRGPFPVGVESLWFRPVGDNYQLRNIPFFIDGLSFEDIVSLVLVTEDTYELERVVKQSLNSTVWLYLKDKPFGIKIVESLELLGCRTETGVIDDFYAISVPEGADYLKISEILDEAENTGKVLVNYASIRC